MIPRELEAQILRLHHAEKWPIGTIATQLSVHHEVVERVVARDAAPRIPQIRTRLIDPYVDFIKETWTRFPRLPTSRLWAMCRERGYTGAKDHFRSMARVYRPAPPAEAFLRLATLPGEQAQVDWAHFGKLAIDGGERPLLCFVAVLSWSRAIFMRYFLGQQVENLLRGHTAAFETWGGVPRVILFDNPKTIVLERVRDAIRLNPTLLDFAAHCRFEPRPVAVARGNEKGRVERAIRYARHAFFLARRWRGLDDLNAQALAWCQGEAMDRPWPQDPKRTVRSAFEEEQVRLLAVPDPPFPTAERREAKVRKTPYARFDGNDYSVPHSCCRQTLVVSASTDTVRILRGAEEVARHPRCYGRRRVIEDPSHIAALVAQKREARHGRGVDRLAHAAPSTHELLERLAERGRSLGGATARLLHLLDTYGAEGLENAIREVLAREAPHVHAVRQVLERERAARSLPPALPVPLPDHPRARSVRVRPHSLAGYDALSRRATTPDHEEDPS